MNTLYLIAYFLFVFVIISYIIYLIKEMIDDKKRKI